MVWKKRRNSCVEWSSCCVFLSSDGVDGNGAGDVDGDVGQGHNSCAVVYALFSTPCDFYEDDCFACREGHSSEESRWVCDHPRDHARGV